MNESAVTARRALRRTMSDLLRECERDAGGARLRPLRNLTVGSEPTTIKLMRSRARRSFVLVALVIVALGAMVPSMAFHVDDAVLPALAFVGLVFHAAAVVVIRRIAVR